VKTRGVEEKTAMARLVKATGRATLMASSSAQVALEGYQGHGVFTWALIEGLKGKAADRNKQITVSSLADYVSETLPELTYKQFGYEQVPQRELQGMNFPIGVRQDKPYSGGDERLRGLANTAKTKSEAEASQPKVTAAASRVGLIAGRYRDNGDGTVTDVTTRLQWQRCSVGQTWTGSTCSGEISRHNWEEARKLGSRFAGHNDWRLPTKDELQTLIYCSSGQPTTWNKTGDKCQGEFQEPTIDTVAFPNTPSSMFFWSSSPDAGITYYAWFVGFDSGSVYSSFRFNVVAVRLVRASQ